LDKAATVNGRDKEIQKLLDYSHGAEVDLEKIGKIFTNISGVKESVVMCAVLKIWLMMYF
jgi:hypothetical protein